MAGKEFIGGKGQPGVGVEGIEGDQALAGVDIPQFDGVVIRRRGQQAAVRGNKKGARRNLSHIFTSGLILYCLFGYDPHDFDLFFNSLKFRIACYQFALMHTC